MPFLLIVIVTYDCVPPPGGVLVHEVSCRSLEIHFASTITYIVAFVLVEQAETGCTVGRVFTGDDHTA